jgi:hypothetical protein
MTEKYKPFGGVSTLLPIRSKLRPGGGLFVLQILLMGGCR